MNYDDYSKGNDWKARIVFYNEGLIDEYIQLYIGFYLYVGPTHRAANVSSRSLKL